MLLNTRTVRLLVSNIALAHNIRIHTSWTNKSGRCPSLRHLGFWVKGEANARKLHHILTQHLRRSKVDNTATCTRKVSSCYETNYVRVDAAYTK